MKRKNKLSVIVPVFNEEKTIARVIKKVVAQKNVGEIIIVDDGSTDNSKLKIQSLKLRSKVKNLKILSHHQNLGKGVAVRVGIKNAKCDYIIIQDADLEYDPLQYNKLLAYARGDRVIYGSRLKTKNPRAYLSTYLGNVLLTKFGNLLFGVNLSDSYTCYKLLPNHIAKSLKLSSKGFEVEAEITAKLAKYKIMIMEIPIKYKPRSYIQGKKIRVRDAIIGALTFLKIRIFN